MSDDSAILKDCRIDIYRAGFVRVRVTHLPTGETAEAVHASSQFQARREALGMILKSLAERRGGSQS